MNVTPDHGLTVLNLGCGLRKLDFPEAGVACRVVGVDASPNADADVVHDLNSFPYPLETGSFDLILLQDVLEHLDDLPRVMHEVHRVARHGGIVRIRTPHFSSWYAYNDPTHRHALGAFALDGFDVASPNPLFPEARFERVSRRILFPRIWRLTGVAALANRFPARWEQLFAFLFRAENIEFELRVVKRGAATAG